MHSNAHLLVVQLYTARSRAPCRGRRVAAGPWWLSKGSTYTDHRGRSPVQESLQLKDTRCCHYHRNCLVDWKVAPTGSRGSWNETFLVLSIGEIECETWTSSFITRLLDSMWKVQMTKRTTMNYWWLLLSFSHLNGWAAADTVRTLICCSVCKGWQTPCVYSSVQNSCFL
jgi:hypothetical protein